MTLNVTIFEKDYVLQISDRRVSGVLNNKPKILEHKNKAVVLSCLDAKLAITYTGLGTTSKGGVDSWLVDTLMDSRAADLHSSEVVQIIARGATHSLTKTLEQLQSGHLFTVVGWSGAERVGWFIYKSEKPGSEFEVRTIGPRRKRMGGYIISGYIRPINRSDRKQVTSLLTNRITPLELEKQLVGLIRRVARTKGVYEIGEDCMAVAITRDGTCVARYHPHKASSQGYAPNLIWRSGGQIFAIRSTRYLKPSNLLFKFGEADRPALILEPPRPLANISSRDFYFQAEIRRELSTQGGEMSDQIPIFKAAEVEMSDRLLT